MCGSFYIYFVTTAANFLEMITGASTGWSSPMVFKLQSNDTQDYPFPKKLNDDEISWIASALNLGSIFGPLLIGKLPDYVGRKNTVTLMAFPYIIAYGILTFSHEVYLYIIARFLVGLIVGGSLAIMPVYISEVCHRSHRGFIDGCGIVISALGTIFSYSVGPYASIMTYNLIIFIASIIFVPLFHFTTPETPYYLSLQGKFDKALQSLEKLRAAPKTALLNELEGIKMNAQSERRNFSLLEVFRDRVARKAFFLVTPLLLLEQLNGVYLILVYAESFFETAGTKLPSEICTIFIGLVMMFNGCIVTPTVDRVGRKKMLYVSSVGTCTMLTILGIYYFFKDNDYNVNSVSWLPVVCLLSSVVFFGTGVGPVPFILMGELFPMNAKCIGSSLAMTIFSVESFLLTRYFMRISKAIGMAYFLWIFASVDVAIFLFVYFFIFETRGRSLNEIQLILEDSLRV